MADRVNVLRGWSVWVCLPARASSAPANSAVSRSTGERPPVTGAMRRSPLRSGVDGHTVSRGVGRFADGSASRTLPRACLRPGRAPIGQPAAQPSAQRVTRPAKAERAGFEPAMEFNPHTRLAGECLQPLGHLSADGQCRARRRGHAIIRSPGGVAERLNATVLKTVVRATPAPRVRIPAPPLNRANLRAGGRFSALTWSSRRTPVCRSRPLEAARARRRLSRDCRAPA
jgi:hypothetical protein